MHSTCGQSVPQESDMDTSDPCLDHHVLEENDMDTSDPCLDHQVLEENDMDTSDPCLDHHVLEHQKHALDNLNEAITYSIDKNYKYLIYYATGCCATLVPN